jgi:hypothetical protein
MLFLLPTLSADESTFGNSSIETCSNVSRIDTDVDTDYDYDDSRLEDENSMTDNCSSIETDDEIEFKIPVEWSTCLNQNSSLCTPRMKCCFYFQHYFV